MFAVGLFWLFFLFLRNKLHPFTLSAFWLSPRSLLSFLPSDRHLHHHCNCNSSAVASTAAAATTTINSFASPLAPSADLLLSLLSLSCILSIPLGSILLDPLCPLLFTFFLLLPLRHLAASPPSRHSCLFSPPTASRPFTSPGTSCQFHFWPGYPLASFAHPSPSISL